MALITLEEAKEQLRVNDTTDFDAQITRMIAQSEDAVKDFLKLADDVPLPDLERVKAAVLICIQSFFDDPKAELISGLGTGDPNNPIVALLYRLRDPALA